eukprot:7956689-Alexandrium_andersonii.AAC.1
MALPRLPATIPEVSAQVCTSSLPVSKATSMSARARVQQGLLWLHAVSCTPGGIAAPPQTPRPSLGGSRPSEPPDWRLGRAGSANRG